MNVAFDPWIPTATLKGETQLICLHDVFTKGVQFADLAVRPHERVSLMRLFLCVAHAALNGPKDLDEWYAVPDTVDSAASAYLEKWKDSFELFHPTKPWLQVAELDLISESESDESDDEKGWAPLRKLCYVKASGNSHTLFDHSANRMELELYDEGEIALNLLTFQNFFVAGGKASERKWGQIEMHKPTNPKGGPCSGKSLLYAFIRDRNLKQTIIQNLNTYSDLKVIYSTINDFIGKPIWEYPIKNPYDKEAIRNATQTHLGRLVPQTRILRLNEDRKRVLLGPGFLYPKSQDDKNPFVPDIFTTIKVNSKNEREVLSVQPEKAIWRELHSMIVYKAEGSSYARGPLCLKNIPDTEDCDLIVSSMVTNPQRAAELVSLVESVFIIPPRMRTDEGRSTYLGEVKTAEFFSNKLGWAIEKYRKEIDGGWEKRFNSAGTGKGELRNKLRSTALRFYWTSVEKNLSLLMIYINMLNTDQSESLESKWRKMLFSTACDAYRTACGQETPRQINAFAKGWKELNRKEDKTENEIESGKEDME